MYGGGALGDAGRAQGYRNAGPGGWDSLEQLLAAAVGCFVQAGAELVGVCATDAHDFWS